MKHRKQIAVLITISSFQAQVGMSFYMVHTDEKIFPDPFTFNPDP
jgi:hypothetical protein